MMRINIGDTVEVVSLCYEDERDTNLKVGDKGIVVDMGDAGVPVVDFGKNFRPLPECTNLLSTGYYMYAKQLKKIPSDRLSAIISQIRDRLDEIERGEF